MGMCCLPASHTFLTQCVRFPTYETRSSGYQPHADVRSSAPSPQSLTGKRSLTYSIAPFMVELFIIEFSSARDDRPTIDDPRSREAVRRTFHRE